ncbi:Protein lin-10, partial [Fragariocoptes setiger]
METAGPNGEEFNIEKLFPRCRPKQRGKQREKNRRTYARRERASKRANAVNNRDNSSDSSRSPKAHPRCNIPPPTRSTRSINQHRLSQNQVVNDSRAVQIRNDHQSNQRVHQQAQDAQLISQQSDERQQQQMPDPVPADQSAPQRKHESHQAQSHVDDPFSIQDRLSQHCNNPTLRQQTSDTIPTSNHVIIQEESTNNKTETATCQAPITVDVLKNADTLAQTFDPESPKITNEHQGEKYLHIFVYDEKNPEEPITLAVDRTLANSEPYQLQQQITALSDENQHEEFSKIDGITSTKPDIQQDNLATFKGECHDLDVIEGPKKIQINNIDSEQPRQLVFTESKYIENESTLSHNVNSAVSVNSIASDESIDSLILLHERVHGLSVQPENLLDQQRQPTTKLRQTILNDPIGMDISRGNTQPLPGNSAREIIGNTQAFENESSSLDKHEIHTKQLESNSRRSNVIQRLDCLSEVESERENAELNEKFSPSLSKTANYQAPIMDASCTNVESIEKSDDCQNIKRSGILPSLNYMSDVDSDIGIDDQVVRSSNGPTAFGQSNIDKISNPNAVNPPDTPENMPISAHVFPKLNEGLSSGAESADEDVFEDDECAADADNDDDDDENDDDDDIDLDSRPSDLMNNNVPGILRHQHQQQISQHSKLPYRLVAGLDSVTEGVSQMQLHSSGSGRPSTNGLMCNDDLNTMIKPEYLIQASNSDTRNDLSNSDQAVDNKSLDTKAITYGENSMHLPDNDHLNFWQQHPSTSVEQRHSDHSSHMKSNNNSQRNERKGNQFSSDTDDETDRLLGSQRTDQLKMANSGSGNTESITQNHACSEKNKTNSATREVLIEGVLFIVKYLGSTQLDCDGQSSKHARVSQAEQAVIEVKTHDGESQPYTEVQLFISTEKIMVLDHKHKKIMMDHSLRTISYIADIGDILVLMARRKHASSELNDIKSRRTSKMICHVFESDEAQLIAQSMNQAFQVAYMEFMKANGIDDTSFLPKEMDYQEVLNSQEMSTEELDMFAKKDNQKEVIVPKKKGEILGISIVESGWGSMLPTVVIANLKPDGPAYRCKKLSVGDQILSVDGNSLVGLPLAECQEIIRRTRKHTVAKLSIVSYGITVEVKIKRPDTKYQLGFSVQNGVICSLLRGGIAERGGVRVGHRIMSINGTTVVGVPHEKIVNLLASSVGEIRMKTCLTSLYRLILGQENPVHF